ncbi:lipid-A-disaccharide synthase [Helicobacter cynogastricus]|uniref:lipid-A-disaccharide synthase n=1 Tax=Helicobacter cynogastricus TaxID=329937 RepID=UPI000CF0FC16|nr:lipid-A-disaccharide synthase [Helicobacter cynogastricus]
MKVLVSALEVSANVHLKVLRAHLKDIEWLGIYEPIEPTDRPLFSPKTFSVMGFKEVFGKLFFFYQMLQKMRLLAQEADVILLMDSSSFNLPLAKRIKKKYPQKPIIYYILPQVWAWKSWRAKTLERYCDKLGAILPFELQHYSKKASYVGHPLLDEIAYYKDSHEGQGVVFMPGSRKQEIRALFPIFVEVAKTISQRRILVVPAHLQGSDLKALYGAEIDLFEISYNTHESLYQASFAFICSGTATLEAALIGTPFVLAYKAKALDFFIVKHLVKLTCIGLANIFYNALHQEPPGRGKTMLHQEFIQEDVNPANLLEVYTKMDRVHFVQEAKKLRDYLAKGSASQVATWIEEYRQKT